jgi:phage portal protein BeeE
MDNRQKRYTKLIKRGLMTPNQARKNLKLPPL